MTGGWRLQRLDGSQAGQRYPLNRDVLTLGHHPASDIRLAPDDAPAVAPRHAALIRETSGWVIRHLDGEAGTWVNGARIRRERRLEAGDLIGLGPNGPTFKFEEHPQTAPELVRHPGRRARRLALPLALAAALAAAWWVTREMTSSPRGHSALLARLDSLTDLLRATEARESTLTARLEEAVGEALATRAMLAESGEPRIGLDSLTRRVERLGEIQGELQRAAAFDVATVVAANRDAVALLLVEREDRSAVSGTAVAVHRSGDTAWVATSRHLVVDSTGRPARRLGLAFDGTAQVFEALLVASDPDHDLALLRVGIRGGTPVIATGAPRPAPGTAVAVITFPRGLELAGDADWRATGVTAHAFAATVSQMTPERLVLDGYGSPGMSGSPVLNATGEIAGIIYGGAAGSAHRLVFAVPGEALTRLLVRAGLR